MLNLITKRMLVFASTLSVFVAIALPTMAFGGQGRGNGQARRYGQEDVYGQERHNERDDEGRRGGYSKKKYRRFINGHDARDGRWDGRGPRRVDSYSAYPGNYPIYQNVYCPRIRTPHGIYNGRDRGYRRGNDRD